MADEKIYLDQYDDGNPNIGIVEDVSLSEDQRRELQNLIGEIIYSFNALEDDLDRYIANGLNQRSTQPGYTITAELTPVFTKKISVFKSLYGPRVEWTSNKDLNAHFQKLVKDLYKIKDVRNEVAHANWLCASDEYDVRIKIGSDEKGPYAILKKMDPDYLRDKISTMEDISGRLDEFDDLLEAAENAPNF